MVWSTLLGKNFKRQARLLFKCRQSTIIAVVVTTEVKLQALVRDILPPGKPERGQSSGAVVKVEVAILGSPSLIIRPYGLSSQSSGAV